MLDSLSTAATHITDHNWSFYGIIAEKRKKVNNFFHIFRIFSIFSEKKKKNFQIGIYRADAQNAKLGFIVPFVCCANLPLPCHCEAAFAAVAISRYNLTTIIAHEIEVSVKMCHNLNILRYPTFYQEIATSLRSSQ